MTRYGLRNCLVVVLLRTVFIIAPTPSFVALSMTAQRIRGFMDAFQYQGILLISMELKQATSFDLHTNPEVKHEA